MIEYMDTNARSGDGANQLLTKILQRLNWSAAVQPGVIPANVAVTNTPLPVTWNSNKPVMDAQLIQTNALLADIDTEIDQIELDLIAIHIHQTSIDGKLTTTNALLTASEAHEGSVDTKMTANNASLVSIDSKLSTVSGGSAAFMLEQIQTYTVAIADGIYIRDYDSGQRASVSDDGHLSTVSVPLTFEISHGGKYGTRDAQVFRILGRRVGFNSTAVLQDVGEWLSGTINLFPVLTGTEIMEVVSSSAQDDTGQTGIFSIRLVYLDTAYAIKTVDVVLDGTTPVGLGAIRMRHVYWMEALTGGTSEVAVGNIDLRVFATGEIHERITAGGNKSLSARFMVPDGFEAFVPEWSVSTIGTSQDVRLRATVSSDDRALCAKYVFQDSFMTASDGNMAMPIPYLKLPARARIKVSTLSGATANTNKIQTAFTAYLVSV